MKMARSFTRANIMPALLGAVTLLTLLAASRGAESPAAVPVAAQIDNSTPDSMNPFFMPESILTAEQRTQYRAAVESSRGRLLDLDTRLQTVRRELNEAVLAERLDENLVREKAAAIAQLEGEKAVLRARALAVIRPSLTPEQLGSLKARNAVPRPKATPEQMEARRQEVKTNLATRLTEEHEATRQQLAVKLETEITDLRKKQAGGTLTAEEKDRLGRLERMRDHIKTGGE